MSIGSEHLTTSTRQDDADESIDADSVLCSDHGFRLWRANDYGWLVRTGADPTGEVYACIDASDNEFELMELVGGFRWTTHVSLHLALKQLLLHVPLAIDRIDSGLEAARPHVDAP